MENRTNIENIETRSFAAECRALEKDGKKYIEGYAAVYEKKSKLLGDWYGGGFYEIISRGAFDEVLNDKNLDVIMSFDHDYSKVIARTVSKTLTLESDNYGLKYTAEVPDISYARDLHESIKRGDIFESSFTFRIAPDGQTWSVGSDNEDIRTITKIMLLKEVAPVVWGAYANTDVAARSLKEIHDKETSKTDEVKETPVLNINQKKLDLIRLKK